MADYFNLTTRGAAELGPALRAFPGRFQRNVVRGALRAGARVIQRAAKAGAPVRTGAGRAAIRIASGRTRSGVVRMSVRAGTSRAGRAGAKGDTWYMRLVESGTKPHTIKPRRAKALVLGGVSRGAVFHPGAKANPFMSRALSSSAQQAVGAFSSYVQQRMSREIGGAGYAG